MKSIAILSAIFGSSTVLGLAINPQDGYYLNLTLVNMPTAKYWLLTDDNLPSTLHLPTSPSAVAPSHLPETGASVVDNNKRMILAQRDADPVCDTRHQATIHDCYNLLVALSNDLTDLQEGPRNIRYNNCYVSWSKPAREAVRAHLYNAGAATYNKCNLNGKVSGLRRGVTIGITTGVTQCLSNRPDGCTA